MDHLLLDGLGHDISSSYALALCVSDENIPTQRTFCQAQLSAHMEIPHSKFSINSSFTFCKNSKNM
jgi:hypothetical protein